ncbi:hypothetical protein Nepgr_007352 [Nepenthes gracilis]|uniref:Uncharacterized protein n=1 Tax=Nepenthes gracilis TaxID=150966 RepID=A0AAD3S6P9_NEPGR|nr:hypothetical protein Nepgr_007352 [Nepenthes gracilis]
MSSQQWRLQQPNPPSHRPLSTRQLKCSSSSAQPHFPSLFPCPTATHYSLHLVENPNVDAEKRKMPLVRFDVKREYGLGVPDLYHEEADREDPKVVLDGVTVAALVGILRQLGELAEFASLLALSFLN